MPPANPPVGYRIRQGETLAAYVWSADNVVLGGHFRVLYDDGGLEDWSLDQLTTGTARTRLQMFTNRVAVKDGWVIAGGFTFQGGTKTKYGMTYAQVGIIAEPGSDETWRATVCQGYVYFGHTLAIGEFQEPAAWTEYTFQGTVAETADAGTHVVTLTVTGATGSLMKLMLGHIGIGATATPQVSKVELTDGTNIIATLFSISDTSSSIQRNFPSIGALTTNVNNYLNGAPGGYVLPLGATLVLTVTTTAVSVTQTFAVTLQVTGGVKPTATLNDTVGAFTPTVNTDALVGMVQPT